MSNQLNLKFSQMLCSRICHDLISPIGAINSGLELLEDSAHTENKEIIDLIAQSSVAASKKLSLFRFALGYGANISCLNDLKEIVESSIDNNKFKVYWRFPENTLYGHVNLKEWSRIIVNIIIIAMESAPYGGNIEIEIIPSNNFQVLFKLISSTITLNEDTSNTLQSNSFDLTPRNVNSAFVSILAESVNKKISIKKIGTNELNIMTEDININLQKINS